MIDAFKLAGEQIREIADASDGTVQVDDEKELSSGNQQIDISIRFEGLERVEGGLRVRTRESFQIIVASTFPFHYPIVQTQHVRFSGFRHVQWRRQLCLYLSASDWRPEDGMYGFIRRLDAWIRDAASNNLDPNDAPLHPPIAYPTVDRLIVPRANTPWVDGSPWFGFAELRDRNNRTEIVDWKELDQERPAYFAPSILLHEEFPFEYPETVDALLSELKSHGIDTGSFLFHLASWAQHSGAGTPLIVVLGTPMRRVDSEDQSLQHLAVWEISAIEADRLRRLMIATEVGDKTLFAAITEVAAWSLLAKVGWCNVSEMRPEVTVRRDHSAPMAWFREKRVAIWGCGAVGTHVAESVVRAGAEIVELADNKAVTPGILVRQGFEDADIGISKACALAKRLKRINPDVATAVSIRDLILRIADSNSIPNVDLIIDCTASPVVGMKLEHVLRDVDSRPAICSIAIDSLATTAIATLSMPNHSGGTFDLMRRLKLETCREPKLSKILDTFWSKTASDKRFQPEPGCSEPTFIGSNADLAGLSARMLNSIARSIATSNGSHTGAGWLSEESGPIHAFAWSPDHILRDEGSGYSVRLCSNAVRELCGWARRSVRTAGATIETGGLVFGELNEAAGVFWVTDVEGPPPDSHAAEDHFTCGTEGMKEAAQERHCRFRGSVECVGSWHTHPTSPPDPSTVDTAAVAQLLSATKSNRRTFLILILSGNPDDPRLGAHAFRSKKSGENSPRVQLSSSATMRLGTPPKKSQNVGLALSGGGSRAIAFHLGCLRALHDLDLLSRVQVISSVSGGSVISAMYAYSSDSFQEFDARVVELLRRGLHRDIIREVFRLISLGKVLIVHFLACVSSVLRLFLRLVCAVERPGVAPRSSPPPVRTFSRTEAFRDVIANSLFGDCTVHDVARDSLHTVINATELRTGSAFRFGSKQSGCWRFGTIGTEDALVADAVAASAAYPIYLPALDRKFSFKKNGRITNPTRVLLTDGGVFDNLGVGPMEPGRVPSISTNVFDPDYIICCDAGVGLFDDDSYPTRWPSRMRKSFLTVFRKVNDATRKRLHNLSGTGEISGFALCYLGQLDKALPWIPAGLPRRDEVKDYPTDFAAMSPEDIDRLAFRGELLMRFLVAYYLPDL